MARKAWNQLSEDYRKRLIRSGITPQQHAAGTDISKARGHNEKQFVDDWITDSALLYGRDRSDVQEVIDDFGFIRVYKALKLQTKMQDAYHNGKFGEATKLWRKRDQGLPDWMNFYHGYFS